MKDESETDGRGGGLTAAIAAEIRAAGGCVAFARFMELALYHPRWGYYTAGTARIGKAGDFITSVSVGPLYGRILARYFRRCQAELGAPPDFEVVEFGGRNGQLRKDVLAEAPELNYRVIEVGAPAPERIAGCVFSNELLDALPVHRVRAEAGEWKEIYVEENVEHPPSLGSYGATSPTSNTGHRSADGDGQIPNGGFQVPDFPPNTPLLQHSSTPVSHHSIAPPSSSSPPSLHHSVTPFRLLGGPLSDPRLAEALRGLPAELMEGYTTEVNLRAQDWLADVSRRLARGFVVTVDYGFERDEYYAPHRRDGTLACYRRHVRGADPLQCPGEQDLTAHVDFTALMEHGRRLGLATVTFTDQGRFLLDAGKELIEEIVVRDAGRPSAERNIIHQLIHPALMGRAFKALVQRK